MEPAAPVTKILLPEINFSIEAKSSKTGSLPNKSSIWGSFKFPIETFPSIISVTGGIILILFKPASLPTSAAFFMVLEPAEEGKAIIIPSIF